MPFDGVIAENCTGSDGITGVGGASCCVVQPCLFNMAIDREENHDVAAANPTVVKSLLDIIANYAKTEVSIQESGKSRHRNRLDRSPFSKRSEATACDIARTACAQHPHCNMAFVAPV